MSLKASPSNEYWLHPQKPAMVSSAQSANPILAERHISVPDLPVNNQLANSDRLNPEMAASSVIKGRTAQTDGATSINNVAEIKKKF